MARSLKEDDQIVARIGRAKVIVVPTSAQCDAPATRHRGPVHDDRSSTSAITPSG